MTVTVGGLPVAAGSLAPGELPVPASPEVGTVYRVAFTPTGVSTLDGIGIITAVGNEGRFDYFWAEFTLINAAEPVNLVVPMANGGFAALACAPPGDGAIADCNLPLPVAPAVNVPLLVVVGQDQVAAGTIIPPRR